MNDKINNIFNSTYELGKFIGAKEEQIRLIKLIKELSVTEDNIGPFLYIKDLVDYLENNYDKSTH